MKYNVMKMSISDLVKHISSLKIAGVFYGDIRSYNVGDLKHFPTDELRVFLLNFDHNTYIVK